MTTKCFTFALITISLVFISCFSATSSLTLVTNPYCYKDHSNDTIDDLYQQNLETVFDTLASHASLTHYYNTSFGRNHIDKAYASFYCRYDVSLDVCETCIKAAKEKVLKFCPYQKEAFVHYFECSLRYANRNFFSESEVQPFEWRRAPPNNLEDGLLNQTISGTMRLLIDHATFESSSPRYFATGEYSTNSRKLYCLVLCTPDLSSLDCKTCLNFALNATTNTTAGRQWGMVFLPNCQMRYSLYPFYKAALASSSSNNSDNATLSDGGSMKKNPTYSTTMLAIVLTSATGLLLVLSAM